MGGGESETESDFEEQDHEDLDSDLAEPIQLDDISGTEFHAELLPEPSVEPLVAKVITQEPDDLSNEALAELEADVDEEALQDLWKPQEEPVVVKMAEKEVEIPVKPPARKLVGEEQFYLEPLD